MLTYVIHTLLSATLQTARLLASDALTAFRSFRVASERWLSAQDDVDVQVQSEELDKDDENEEDEEAEVNDDLEEVLSPNSPEIEWKLAQRTHGVASEAMNKLMALTGLKEVKARAMGVCMQVLLSKGRPADLRAEITMNFLFIGNPGCGKTTVAELLSAAMGELGFRSNPKPLITSATDILRLKDPPADFALMVDAATGGTIFIDEAYQFKPTTGASTPNASNHVLDYILKVSETKRETTSFILAGYRDDMDDLLKYNDGFRSRFPFVFQFSDYTEPQLRKIFIDMVKQRGFRLQTRRECGVPIAKVLSQRLSRGAGKKEFGNAREVRNRLELSINNQSLRLGSLLLYGKHLTPKDYRTLTRSDVLGERPDLGASALLKELNSMVGLAAVKAAVKGLMELQLQNYEREERGEKPELISLHRVFVGNPGTGRCHGALLMPAQYLLRSRKDDSCQAVRAATERVWISQ
jgi:Holliday junction resolvasome RuvABC ATP-dependent DNA helicase subunit